MHNTEIRNRAHAGLPVPAAVLALLALAAVATAALFVFRTASAQESGGAELTVMDVGGAGQQFMLDVTLQGETAPAAQVTFTETGSDAIALDAGTYIVSPLSAEGFGYMGWATADESGVCPTVPTAGGAEIEVNLEAGASTILCIFHEPGQMDVSTLKQASESAGNQSQDAQRSEDAQQQQANQTPQAPSTGTGTASAGGDGTSVPYLVVIGSIIALTGGLSALALRRREHR